MAALNNGRIVQVQHKRQIQLNRSGERPRAVSAKNGAIQGPDVSHQRQRGIPDPARGKDERDEHMAYATDIRTAGTFGDRIAAIFKTIGEARAQRKIYNRTLNELRGLDARDLADLGISRSEIPFLAREAAYGK